MEEDQSGDKANVFVKEKRLMAHVLATWSEFATADPQLANFGEQRVSHLVACLELEAARYRACASRIHLDFHSEPCQRFSCRRLVEEFLEGCDSGAIRARF